MKGTKTQKTPKELKAWEKERKLIPVMIRKYCHGKHKARGEELCEECIPGLRIDHVDISGLPMANPDLETDGGDGFPPAVEAGADAVLAASVFHYGKMTIGDVKEALRAAGYTVR